MRIVYLIGWAITRPISLFVFYFIAEPILSLTAWLAKKACA